MPEMLTLAPGVEVPVPDDGAVLRYSSEAVQDTVDVRAPRLLEDSEVDSVLDDTLNMIAQDNVAALSVHGGLSQSRVFALLGL